MGKVDWMGMCKFCFSQTTQSIILDQIEFSQIPDVIDLCRMHIDKVVIFLKASCNYLLFRLLDSSRLLLSTIVICKIHIIVLTEDFAYE